MTLEFTRSLTDEEIATIRAEMAKPGKIMMLESEPFTHTVGWQPIDTAPKARDEQGHRPQVLLIGAYPAGLGSTVWSDVRHGWWDEVCEKWERWPHWFPPSHWMPLPTPPDNEEIAR